MEVTVALHWCSRSLFAQHRDTANLNRIANLIVGQRRSHLADAGICTEVQLPPQPACGKRSSDALV